MNKAYDVDETRNFFAKNARAAGLTLVGSVGGSSRSSRSSAAAS